jgi:hypothetical protein
LFNLNARTATNGCNAMQGQLDPGAATVDCATQAGDESGTLTSTVTAKLGKEGGDRRLRAGRGDQLAQNGELVTITITVGNPSALPISDVEVAGEPAACRKTVPVLQPRERLTCTRRAAAR